LSVTSCAPPAWRSGKQSVRVGMPLGTATRHDPARWDDTTGRNGGTCRDGSCGSCVSTLQAVQTKPRTLAVRHQRDSLSGR